jgi:hypothetical protein
MDLEDCGTENIHESWFIQKQQDRPTCTHILITDKIAPVSVKSG